MSYILDALRRAEADRERERGQVPGLNAQPPSGGEPATAAGQRRWLPWAGGGLLLLAGIGAGSWWASGPNDAVAPVPQAAPTPAPALARPPLPEVGPPVAPPPAASASPYLAPPAPAPVEVAAVPAPPARSVAEPVPAPAPVAASMPLPAPAVRMPASPAPAPTPAPVVPAAEAPIPRLAELPEALRREVPRLAISGSVYSDDPGSRFVIINGEVQREGARLGNDFVLEQIRQHELVLRFRGQRFRQPV